MNTHPVLVEAWRGNAVESFHRGAWIVADATGCTVASGGDVQRPVFPRSAIKLLQALPLVQSGAADRFGLDDRELALACASHGGEAVHAATAASMLAKAGLDASVLECGTHWPYEEGAKLALAAAGRAPGPLHNNCSGKHAGFVCLGCMLAGDGDARTCLAGYVRQGHPVMREVDASIESCTGWRLADAPRGVDGCSIPTYGIPLSRLALAFARAGTGAGLTTARADAARRLREAVAREPHMVAGTGRFDTQVMQHFGLRVFCKVGAEGVYCAALPEQGLGIALKMDDGTTARAAEVALAALLQGLLAPLDDAGQALLAGLARPALRNWQGLEVGRLAPHATLDEAAKRSGA